MADDRQFMRTVFFYLAKAETPLRITLIFALIVMVHHTEMLMSSTGDISSLMKPKNSDLNPPQAWMK